MIQKAAVRFGFDDSRPRFSPPKSRILKPLSEDTAIDAKFHSAYRSKVGFLSYVALSSRPDLNFAAVNAARQLQRPSPEADDYVSEALQFLFSTATWEI